MSPRRVWAITLRQFYLMRESPTRVLPLFAWVAVDIFLWGYMTRYLAQVTTVGNRFVPSLLGAVLLWDFFGRIMLGVTTAFLEDVWSRNFLNLFASPLKTPEYLAGLILTSITTSLVGMTAMLLLACAVFGLSLAAYGAMVYPFLLILFVFGIALGVFASAIVLRFGPASEWLVWPLPSLLCPFAGVFYPVATLPAWMQAVATLLPPSYVFEGMRSVVLGTPLGPHALLQGGLLAGFYLLLAGWFFDRVYRQAVRSGLLARYSAESVS